MYFEWVASFLLVYSYLLGGDGMPFSWMVSFLCDGTASYRRLEWPSIKYIAWRNGGVMVTMDGGFTWTPYAFNDSDVSAKDWRAVK